MNKNDKTYRRNITSRRWLALRRKKLTAHPLCEVCECEGLVVAASEVHHKRPVESAASQRDQKLLMYDYDNLMSVCHKCHVALHVELGSHTKETVKARQQGEARHAIARLYGDEREPGEVF